MEHPVRPPPNTDEDSPNGFRANFLLGHITITDEALRALGRFPYDLIARHAVNDHGSVTRKELQKNLVGLHGDGRLSPVGGAIKSRYRANPTAVRSEWIVIETNDSWSVTTITVE